MVFVALSISFLDKCVGATGSITYSNSLVLINCCDKLGALEDDDVAVHVDAAVLPQHRVPSLYQRPETLRRARLAVRHAVAEAARSPYFDLSTTQRLLHGEREGRFRSGGGRRDHKELFEPPNVGHDVARRQQVIIGARGAAQKRACAAIFRGEPATRWHAT